MRLRRLCLEIFAFRRFFREPIRFNQLAGLPERNASIGCAGPQQFFHNGPAFFKASRKSVT
jgi:hypothetical protein